MRLLRTHGDTGGPSLKQSWKPLAANNGNQLAPEATRNRLWQPNSQ
jgi:hypothetical protein